MEVRGQYLEIISFLPLDGSCDSSSGHQSDWQVVLPLPHPPLLASSCNFWDSPVMWPLLLYVASSLFPQPNARPLWAPLRVSIGGNPVWKASSFCLWEAWGRKGSYFASLNVLGFNNVSDISVSSMRRNNRVSPSSKPMFYEILHLWFPVDRGIMSKGLWLVSELEASLKS